MRYMPIQSPASTSSFISQYITRSCECPMEQQELLTIRVDRLSEVTRSVSLVDLGMVTVSWELFLMSMLWNWSGLQLYLRGSLHRRRFCEFLDGDAMAARPRNLFWYRFCEEKRKGQYLQYYSFSRDITAQEKQCVRMRKQTFFHLALKKRGMKR